jgi:citrate synthase
MVSSVPEHPCPINVDYRQPMALLTTRQAAHRLGVKVETLYAYVSRGLLRSHRPASGRSSLFDEREVETLARRGRPRHSSRPRSLDITIETAVTAIGDGGHRYRGHDAIALAHSATFEQVAELLWSGTLPPSAPTWAGEPLLVPPGSPAAMARAAVTLDALRAERAPLDEVSVAAAGRRLVAVVVESLPLAGEGRTPRLPLSGDGPPVRGTIAGRLWVRLTGRRAKPALVAALNAALVLLADHELAASTLAARVAASTRAGPHAVVLAGMAALSGPLHGGEGLRARAVLEQAAACGPGAAITVALERHGRVPGFGHALYERGDPRATALIDLLRPAAPPALVGVVDAMVREASRRGVPPPNVDFAVAVLGQAICAPGATEVVFVVARMAGWLAHALEEYGETPVRFRPRAHYVGT